MKLSDLDTGLTCVLGFAREGRALERVLMARNPDARVEVVCDREPESQPRHWPLRVRTPDRRLLKCDRVLRSPGVPESDPILVECRARGIPVTGISSLWFGQRPDARVIAVTGSKGKSTTAALIAHLLAESGLHVELAGNIGRPLIDLLDAAADWFVIELSSYQLADLVGHATIGVMTRLFPEHVDWHGSLEAYYAAKLRLAGMLDGRPLLIQSRDPVLSSACRGLAGVVPANRSDGIHARAEGIFRRDACLLAAADSPLPGRHNLDNIALALSVVDSIGIDVGHSGPALRRFNPLPHRLQRLGDVAGRSWINDSISTTPYATRAALEACAEPPLLIVGGFERGADWQPVVEVCRNRPLAGLVALPDNGARIAAALIRAGAVDGGRAASAENMIDAVFQAHRLAPAGTCVLLSPGAPSFPRFRDFEQRGECFIDAVASLGVGTVSETRD